MPFTDVVDENLTGGGVVSDTLVVTSGCISSKRTLQHGWSIGHGVLIQRGRLGLLADQFRAWGPQSTYELTRSTAFTRTDDFSRVYFYVRVSLSARAGGAIV